MVIRLILSIILTTILILPLQANPTIENIIKSEYIHVIDKLNKEGFYGPISNEIGSIAFCRFILENGVNRPTTYSVPGISCGSWNTQIITNLKPIKLKELCLGKVVDSEGMSLFKLEGHQSNVWSTIAIAKLFDYYIHNFKWFSDQDRYIWAKSKKASYLIYNDFHSAFFYMNKDKREKILQRCSGGYGPKNDNVIGMKNKYKHLFDSIFNNLKED